MAEVNPQLDPSAATSHDAAATNGAGLKDTVVNNTAAAVNTIQNHPITQNIVNGPLATSVKNEAGAVNSEFSDLASSKQPPTTKAANDTPLTHYHSFFYTLLSWKNPRATGITFAGTIIFIFACRYLPILSWGLRMTWMTLGVVALAETSAKFIMGTSVASTIRPRKYYKIPKESLEASLDDLEQLINFFVIEVQRVIFAENIPVTIGAFGAAFLTYYLIKIVPLWGMALIATCVLYLAPLIYIQNQQLIDEHITHAHHVIAAQANQVKELTAQHTGQGLETLKQYTGDYAAKAQEALGVATLNRQKIPAQAPGTTVKEGDFPSAPKTDLPSAAEHTKPVVSAPAEGGPIAASAS